MIVTATGLAKESQRILDRVVESGEIVEIQRHGKTAAVIQAKTGVTRAELQEALRGRGFTEEDARELKAAMDTVSDAVGYAGGD